MTFAERLLLVLVCLGIVILFALSAAPTAEVWP